MGKIIGIIVGVFALVILSFIICACMLVKEIKGYVNDYEEDYED